MRELPPALAAMGAYAQFIVYRAVPGSKPGKTDKLPCDFRTGDVVTAHDPQYWTTAQTAINAAATLGDSYGLGFVFTSNDPFWFIDIDNCLTDANEWSPVAQQLCGHFTGAACEVSRSGTGLHLFGTGNPGPHRSRAGAYGVEFYTEGRFVALTGHGAIGDAGKDFTAELPAFVQAYVPAADDAIGGAGAWVATGPRADWRGPTDDAQLVARALASKPSAAQAFGDGVTFADLWHHNIEALSKRWPDPGRGYNPSDADAALAQHLAFWTGCDTERMERIMLGCTLARDKYSRADGTYGTYLRRTIMGAVARQTQVLTEREVEPVAAAIAPVVEPYAKPRPQMVTGSTFVGPIAQCDIFEGCVYVQDIHRVLVPGGVLLKPEQFKVAYGGYTYGMDNANERTTRDSWEAFTQSQAFRCPRVASACFKPDMPPGAIVTRGGQQQVNTWWPVEVPRMVGDATPFLEHLRKLIPDERDREIVLSYMCFCVQHKGYKAQWALMLQGVEGNGKSMLSRCVAEALGRRYVHWPKASQIANHFNAWMVAKLFYAVEDIYVPGERAEVFEILKPMITGENLEIEGKGVDQITSDVCGNFMLNSNHKGALPKTANDRRLGIIHCAQQAKEHLARDGMGGGYFPALYNWLKADGYAIVSELLHTRPILDEFNPATACQIAPTTTSTAAAIAASEGSIEQEIREAIETGEPGFTDGWVSSIMLDKLLSRIGRGGNMSRNARVIMLEGMGYHKHPALPDGRCNNEVSPDAGKPRLFIHDTAAARHITDAAKARKAYEDSNNHQVSPHAKRAFG